MNIFKSLKKQTVAGALGLLLAMSPNVSANDNLNLKNNISQNYSQVKKNPELIKTYSNMLNDFLKVGSNYDKNIKGIVIYDSSDLVNNLLSETQSPIPKNSVELKNHLFLIEDVLYDFNNLLGDASNRGLFSKINFDSEDERKKFSTNWKSFSNSVETLTSKLQDFPPMFSPFLLKGEYNKISIHRNFDEINKINITIIQSLKNMMEILK